MEKKVVVVMVEVVVVVGCRGLQEQQEEEEEEMQEGGRLAPGPRPSGRRAPGLRWSGRRAPGPRRRGRRALGLRRRWTQRLEGSSLEGWEEVWGTRRRPGRDEQEGREGRRGGLPRVLGKEGRGRCSQQEGVRRTWNLNGLLLLALPQKG